MFERNRQIISVGQFIEQITDLETQWSRHHPEGERTPLWHRGQSRTIAAGWTLLPKLFRMARVQEFELRRQFRRRHRPFITSPLELPPDHWHEYFMMQHYGVTTRLLDWTEGALLALYFAIRESRRFKLPESDAAVYVLRPLSLNSNSVGQQRLMYTEMDEAKPYLPQSLEVRELPELPIALAPDYSTQRIIAQRGVFTLHGDKGIPLETMAESDQCDLVEFIIPQASIIPVRIELLLGGIEETTLFPDLEGLGREINFRWTLER